MRALPPPDEMADLAAELLDGLESSVDPSLDDAAIEALDQRAATLLTSLSVSEECIAGVPG